MLKESIGLSGFYILTLTHSDVQIKSVPALKELNIFIGGECIQMKRKELTKTFMMTSNWKKSNTIDSATDRNGDPAPRLVVILSKSPEIYDW